MLRDLIIKNFAIIDSLHISFGSGFNILTGETGAGKSIIVDAVELVLGGRASSEMVRSGCDEAVVEAVFDISRERGVADALMGMGLEAGESLLIKRAISSSGKNKVFINGSLATTSMLSQIGDLLIDIHGQHEHQMLFRVERHIDILDEYAGHSTQLHEMAALYREIVRIKGELESLRQSEAEREKKLDMLRFQVEEIGKAGLKEGEEETLLDERKILVNAEKLHGAGNEALDLLYSREGSVLGLIRKAGLRIAEVAAIDDSVRQLPEQINTAMATIEDAAFTLRDYVGRINFSQERLDEIEERLDLIGRLKKKYGRTLQDVLRYMDEAERELKGLENSEESIARLEKESERLSAEGQRLSETVSKKRRKSSSELKKRVETELADLGMKKAVFETRIEVLDDLSSKGIDRIEFLFSSNPGEAPKPLSKIASGGEISRVMLALKKVLSGATGIPTMVFDEVDAGIGGGIAEVVGHKLREVARGRQVLCITHLPQIAAMADIHYAVSKGEAKGRTVTSVAMLEGDERVSEIARMLGGITITEATKRHAEEMLKVSSVQQ